jgi:hypothetical protein
MTRSLTCLLILIALCVPCTGADTLKGDEAKDAKEKLKDVKKEWKKASKADKLVLLRQLTRLPEKTVGNFMKDDDAEDEHDHEAERAARTLTRQNEPKDGNKHNKE